MYAIKTSGSFSMAERIWSTNAILAGVVGVENCVRVEEGDGREKKNARSLRAAVVRGR